MRIRKRFLSLSAAVTPQPPLDLHHQPLHLLQKPQLHPNENLRRLPYDSNNSQPSDPPSSDHTTQIGLPPSIWVSSAAGCDPNDPIVFPKKESEEKKKKEIIKNKDSGCRKESIFSAEASSDHLVLKGWLEGDRLIPIKKRRRGSIGKRVNHDLGEANEMIIEGKTKTKPKKNEPYVEMQEVMSATSLKKNKKNGKRGNVIMEGSRCSRVNGRGWRCCQQTLVGYSLCEHHLGKGRLRSMTSIRGGRAQKIAPKKLDKESEDEDDDCNDEAEFEDWEDDLLSSSMEGMKKCSKKKKLGVVKARSLSSLLSQISSS